MEEPLLLLTAVVWLVVLSFSVEDTDETDEILTSLETSARGGNFLGVRRGELGHDCVTRNGFRSRIDAEMPPDTLVVGPLGSLTSSLMAICPGRDVTDDMDEIDVIESVRLAARYKIGVEGVELVPCRCLK